MKIYLEIENEVILKVNTEDIEGYIPFELNTIEDLYEKYGEVDEEIEEKVKEYLEAENSEKGESYFEIKHWVSNRSFGELIDMYETEEIKKPEMQREFVWDAIKCSRLIESILLGLPIPPLFLLEVEHNKYEVIDGLQRLTALTNFVTGRPWHKNPSAKRIVPSKLSGNLLEGLKGKKFEALEPEQQRRIKRSTIPLIEFRQLNSEKMDSKYLIFERINTGAEKLSSMQIRKALSYGKLMSELYFKVPLEKDFMRLFSKKMINDDGHIEAFLRIKAMGDFYYGRFETKKEGISHILNEYCEKNKSQEIGEEYFEKFKIALKSIYAVFDNDKSKLFKRVSKSESGIEYKGNVNISILESLLAVLIEEGTEFNSNKLRLNYEKIFLEFNDKKEENYFNVHTGSFKAIKRRFEICQNFLVN